jgi:molecular chaperone DnaJ
LLLTLPVTFAEATLGADIKVPTLAGDDVTVRLAPGTPTGRVLRVKGRGITKGSTIGDLLVTIDVQVPRRVEGEALEALKKFAELTAEHDVRSEFLTKAKA